MTSIELKLPYPPTANHIWAQGGRRTFLSKRYKKFIDAVGLAVKRLGGELDDAPFYTVRIVAYPPDRRPRDIDNIIKPILDSLTRAGVWKDDSRVSYVEARKACPCVEPFVVVAVDAMYGLLAYNNPTLYGERPRIYKK